MASAPLRLILALALCAGAAADEARSEDTRSDDQRMEQREQSAAAEYRLARLRHRGSAAEDAAVAEAVRRAQRMLDTGEGAEHLGTFDWLTSWTNPAAARSLAEDGMRAHPYAARVGDLYLVHLRASASSANAGGMLTMLHRLWYRLPEYDRAGEAFAVALAGVERMVAFHQAVDLEAADPRQVVATSGDANLRTLVPAVCRFLIRLGDREQVVPRARLALARTMLLGGTRPDLSAARLEYEEILLADPATPLAFQVLTELALVELGTYRGSDYDSGALLRAAMHIDRAEPLVAGDRTRAELIATFRRRLRGWQQDRDLAVARWYRERGQPAWLAPLRRPPGLADWAAGARLYYAETVRRDPASVQARAAAAEAALLPPPAPEPAR